MSGWWWRLLEEGLPGTLLTAFLILFTELEVLVLVELLLIEEDNVPILLSPQRLLLPAKLLAAAVEHLDSCFSAAGGGGSSMDSCAVDRAERLKLENSLILSANEALPRIERVSS